MFADEAVQALDSCNRNDLGQNAITVQVPLLFIGTEAGG